MLVYSLNKPAPQILWLIQSQTIPYNTPDKLLISQILRQLLICFQHHHLWIPKYLNSQSSLIKGHHLLVPTHTNIMESSAASISPISTSSFEDYDPTVGLNSYARMMHEHTKAQMDHSCRALRRRSSPLNGVVPSMPSDKSSSTNSSRSSF